jgi:ribose transport system ATP-binding protein
VNLADSPAAPLLEMQGIDKAFPGVQALRGVRLTLRTGEVLALVGENGAGKSTLIKILGGAHRPDAGTIRIQGQERTIASPHDARLMGIAVIYQEFNLVPGLSASDNIFLGQERTHLGFLTRREEQTRASQLFARLGVRIDPHVPCRLLTVAQQQTVEIARALATGARILVMDEPSAALTAHEVDRLFEVIRDLKSQGISILYISHRLEEITSLADRVVVLRDGACVADCSITDVTRGRLIEMMVGRELKDEFPRRSVRIGEPRLVVEGLRRGEAVQNVSFHIRRGEVLGLAGLVGAGRTETARLIFGADRREAGEIFLDGQRRAIRNPRDAINAGIALLTEDRKGQGLILGHTVRENFGLPNLPWLSRLGWIQQGQEKGMFSEFRESLRIKVAGPEHPTRNLSGGNQQKVVLAKWLARHCEVFLFDEPTRGIDVGAKYEIYLLINDLVAQGKAILLISSELPEVLGMADRILVMHAGRITGEITDVARASQEEILELAMGGP